MVRIQGLLLLAVCAVFGVLAAKKNKPADTIYAREFAVVNPDGKQVASFSDLGGAPMIALWSESAKPPPGSDPSIVMLAGRTGSSIELSFPGSRGDAMLTVDKDAAAAHIHTSKGHWNVVGRNGSRPAEAIGDGIGAPP